MQAATLVAPKPTPRACTECQTNHNQVADGFGNNRISVPRRCHLGVGLGFLCETLAIGIGGQDPASESLPAHPSVTEAHGESYIPRAPW